MVHLAGLVDIKAPPHDRVGNDGKGIYFDSIDNSAYVLGKAPHCARNTWVYIDSEAFGGMRYDIGGDPTQPCRFPGSTCTRRKTRGSAPK
jgi:hypothetical protein